jgi:hypothetical protein
MDVQFDVAGERSGFMKRVTKEASRVLQMIETQHLVAAPTAMDGARFMQCRLPAAQYEWLRYRAFVDRCSMNSMVLMAIRALREASPDIAVPLTLKQTSAVTGSVKFNVHLADELYEWLRTKAFNSRGSINQLLIKALIDYRLSEDLAYQRTSGAPNQEKMTRQT